MIPRPSIPARTLLAAAALGVAALVGCRSLGPRHQNWWNFYERGLGRMEARDYAGASEDFERCLGFRPGARYGEPRDAWRVRTYGMRMLDNYFPHRELGVCLHLLGRQAEAEKFLLKSLEQEPSDRARHYLGESRAALAPAGPRIVFADATPLHTRRPVTDFAVEVHAPSGLRVAVIDGAEVPVDAAAAVQTVSRPLRLAPGRREVVVTARDAGGRGIAARRVVVFDPLAPSLAETGRERLPDGSWTLRLTAHDGGALHRIEWNGAVLRDLSGEETHEAAFEIRVEPRGQHELRVTDRAGNALSLRPGATLAAAFSAFRHADTAAVGGGPAAPAADGGELDLVLHGPAELTVYAEQCFLDGEVTAPAGLRRLAVNGAEWPVPPAAPGRRVHFAGNAPVAPGRNELRIEAEDREGKRIVRVVKAERREPRFAELQHRLAAVVPPILDAARLPGGLSAQMLLVKALVGRPDPEQDRFQILARGQDFLRVLEEHRLAQADLVDPDARIAWGRLAQADLFFNGQILTNHLGATLRVLIFDARDPGQAWLGSEDVYLPDGLADAPLRIRGLAAKLERRFPLAQGRLENAVEQGRLETPCPPRHPFLVIRPGPDGEMASGTVVNHGPDRLEWMTGPSKDGISRGSFFPREGKKAALPGDFIYTR